MSEALREELRNIPVAKLEFDRRNPRLLRLRPAEGELSDAEIAQKLTEGWDPKAIGRSLAEYGFFPSEPLIVFPEGQKFIVAEGNRRLLAVRLLTDPELRTTAEINSGWDELGERLRENGHELTELPTQVVADRDAAAPVIGYRHIVGIAKWEAYDKAAFVAGLLADGSRDFEAVSDLVGENPNRVKRYLRDFLALKQAEEAGVQVEDAKDEFGRFERAMQARGTREYVGGKSPAEIEVGASEAVSDLDAMRKLLGYLYGIDGIGPLFTDTRRVDDLATALSSEEGRRILASERDLDRAFDAAGGRHDLVVKGLDKALKALVSITADFPDFAEQDDVTAAVDRVRDALDALPTGTAPEPSGGDEEEYDLDSEEEYAAEAEDEDDT